ncbi:portal protein [Methylomonas sp. AM2-LC]|uniref:portal protein n=1 Tax=Methylomonas sp. AM2-LC TaxID=3153301 RepID=UPI0032674504
MDSNQVRLLNQRYQALKDERASWWPQWASISKYITPRSGRYFLTDRNKGWRRDNSIYDNTATRALRVLAAGMMSGMTSPARPWFVLELADQDLMKYQPVKEWLSQCSRLVLDVFAQSNLYRVLHGMYGELGAFGTGGAMLGDSFQNIIQMYPFEIGEYSIATNFMGEVDTIYREFDATVGALVKEFGYNNCSHSVKQAWDKGNLHLWITIRHAIEPRADREPGKLGPLNMPWKSVYWESSVSTGQVLRESGFKQFPCVIPRWMTQGGDMYGNSPGMDCLGDVIGLQSHEFRKLQAVDYKVMPPLQIPTEYMNREIETFPGGRIFYDSTTQNGGIRSAWDVALDLRELLMIQQDVRQRIDDAMYKNLFLMISENTAPAAMTATQVSTMNEEKLLMLGPVVERLNDELGKPLVTIVFERMLKANLLPPAPPELNGHSLTIQFISMLAQAQKQVNVNAIDRFVAGIIQVAAVKPSVLDKLDADSYVDVMGDTLGVDPVLITSNQNLAFIREQQARQQQQMQNNMILAHGANIAKTLGDTNTGPDTAAGQLMQRMQAQQSSAA